MNHTNLIYSAMAVCVVITALPWLPLIEPEYAAKFLMNLVAIICAFLAGISWSWHNSNPIIGIALSFLAFLVIVINNFFIAHLMGAFVLNCIWWLEKKYNAKFLEQDSRYKKAREIGTYVLTICILISGASLLNPY